MLYGSSSTPTATILLLLHAERRQLQKKIYSPSDNFAEQAKQYG